MRLASQLTGHQIDIMTEDEASEKRSREFAERSKMFEEELDVDETLSQLLVAEGFAELEEVAYVELDELAGIEGFDSDLAEELQSRATEALERRDAAYRAERTGLGVEDALAEIPHLTEQMLVTLGKAGIKTLDDLADLATDELIAKKREAPRRRQAPAEGPRLRSDRPKPEDKGGVLGEYGLSKSRATRSSWPRAPTGSRTRNRPRQHPRRPRMRTPNNERLTPDIADAQGSPESSAFGRAPLAPRKAEPERKCILTGEHGARAALVRLAISPAKDDGVCEVLPDVHAKAPGRGAWLAVSRAELETALAKGKLKGAMARAFKGAALSIPEDLPRRIEDALRRALLDRLGLELRAGHLLMGSDRIAEHARGGAVELLLHAQPMPATTARASSTRPGAWARSRGQRRDRHRLATGPGGPVCGIGPRQRRPSGAGRSGGRRAGIARAGSA